MSKKDCNSTILRDAAYEVLSIAAIAALKTGLSVVLTKVNSCKLISKISD